MNSKLQAIIRKTPAVIRIIFNADYRLVQKYVVVIGIGGLLACVFVPVLEWVFAGLPTNWPSLLIAVALLAPIPFFPRTRPFRPWHIIIWELATGYCFVFFVTYNSLATADLMPLGHELLHGAAFYAFFGKSYSFLIGYPAFSLGGAALFSIVHPGASLSAMGFYRALIHAAYLGFAVGCARVAIEHYFFRLIDSQKRVIELEADKRVSAFRLSSLRAKTDPHFLFNTLNSICTIHRTSPDKTESALLSLSRLFRYILDAGDTASVSLAQELHIVDSYLKLERLRFGEKLEYRIALKGAPDGIKIPALTIQTLVENAVKHGLGPQSGKGRITVEVDCAGPETIIRVHDDGPGFSPAANYDNGIPRGGHGLSIVKGRLDIAFQNRYSITCGKAPAGGALVEIRFPRSEVCAA